ncbi:NFACT family protein [Candidatus Bipolaricaulota bacterium]|nr:NFACT family protein [Candidatus Bipolaricaulota bacterium]
MALDGITIHWLKRELQENLTGGWVRKIYQPRRELVTINVWNGEDYTLLISCGTDFRIQLTNLDLENPDSPPNFTMLLRKHLSGGKISRITQRGLDRVLKVEVDKKTEPENEDGEGEIVRKEIYVELMGRNSNLFLVQDENILGTLKEKENERRPVTPGNTYKLPPKQDKVDPFELSEDQFYEFFNQEQPAWRNLLNNIEGIGPTLAKEITARAGVSRGEKDLSGSDVDSLWEAAKELFDELASGVTPLVYQKDGKPVEFSPIELESYSAEEKISFGTLSEALDHYYKAKETSYETKDLREEVETTLEDELGRVQGALKNVEEQLKQSQNRERLKETGDIILANLSELEKGMEKAELNDPYREGEKREVKLDPSSTPEENAQKYYERYKKLKRGKEKLERRKRSLNNELKFLRKLSTNLEEAESREELARIEGTLKEKGYIDEDSDSAEEGDGGGPKEYWVKGHKIMVGRNARQNDELVRNASRDDIWLHVRKYAGAHVVIVTDGRPDQVPEEVIVKAAQLAALNSKARAADKATVSYTQVKYVDKPKGAKPGLVQITNENTITVSPKEVIK